MSKIKVTYIISNIDKALEFEWVAEKLSKEKFELSFILLNTKKSYLGEFLKNHNIYIRELKLESKLNYPKLIIQCINELKKIKPDIVHCHLIDASLVGLLAAKFCRISNRIHTRHHSTFHINYAPNGMKYDKWINKNSKKILAVSNVVKDVLVHTEKVDEHKVKVIPHALDFSIFTPSTQEEIDQIKNKYHLNSYYPIIGVISRYEKWKGVGYIIDAFIKVLDKYPNAKLVLANAGKGDDAEIVKNKLSTISKFNFVEINFEKNINLLYEVFDVFVHVPIDSHSEAFGQIYIEAMYKKIPIVATKSGIGNELLKHNHNSIVVDYKNSDEIYVGICKYIENESFKTQLIENAFIDVEKNYHLKTKIQKLEDTYIELYNESNS